MPNAQPQTPEVGAAKLGGDISHAIVAAVAATLLEPNLAWGNVEFVVDHENLLRGDLVKPRQRSNGGARVVHKGLWAAQPYRLGARRCVYDHLTDPGLKLGFQRPRGRPSSLGALTQAACKLFEQPKANVMPVQRVGGTGITKPG